jgi:hypothetical protein
LQKSLTHGRRSFQPEPDFVYDRTTQIIPTNLTPT